MKWQRILLGIILLISLGSEACSIPTRVESKLPPLEEDKVEVHWIQQNDPAPFSGLLMSEYTYERIRLKLIELGGH